jgi:luciferase family oxidoreductase group 1
VDIPFSILDLCSIPEGGSAGDALRNSARLARHAESLGFKRFWLAEHHNMRGIASAATSVVIGHVAAQTSTIRIGSGGVMLPNHSPLVIAEQFGTLAARYPGRIDLGLGRAPGSDRVTARALRRDKIDDADQFPQDVLELQRYFEPFDPKRNVHAVPGEGLDVPMWILGSSLYGANLAAAFGLPFAFASHFAPDDLHQAAHLYRRNFKASASLAEPYLMVAINAVVAESDQEARRLFSSQQQAFLNLRRGNPGKVPPPVDDIDAICSPMERAMIDHSLSVSFIGTSASVSHQLLHFIDIIRPDEIIVAGHFFDIEARLHSLELLQSAIRLVTF